MAILSQGLVLMFAGMGIVYLFLVVLIFVARGASAFVSKFDYVLPDSAPKKPAARPAASSDDDANVALAIAVAMRG